MFSRIHAVAVLALPLVSSALHASTEGWEDINPDRREVPPTKIVWQTDAASTSEFSFERRDGAKGSFSVSGGKISISKTNGDGYLVLKAKPFKVEENSHLRMFADVEVVAENPDGACGFLRAHGKDKTLRRDFAAEKGNFSSGGAESMLGMRNSAPGTPYRKYAHFIARDGMVTPVIVVGGTPSSSVWRNWTFEDVSAAQTEWARKYAEKTAKDNSSARIDEAELDRILASEIPHDAEVKVVDGVSRFLVDGKVALPVVYAAKVAFGDDAGMETFRGESLERNGVTIMVRSLNMGGKRGTPRCFWTKDGFDAKGAVRDFKNGMRIATNSLFIVRLSCNAYPEYTAEHPSEIWRTEDGRPVLGTAGSCVVGYDDMGIADTNRWPWVSYSSRCWREDVKANIRALVAEFRRQGIDKRIVGIHLCGYHDWQFSAPYPDYSDCARKEYDEYLREKPTYTNYLYFVKQCGFRAQEEFACAFKRAMGKKTVAIRWCMGMFSGSDSGNYDITAFANSDAIDVIVPQPAYERRHPGLAIGPKLPQASFNLHGKMFWYEFDLRTYGALESWAASVVATKGLGQQDDIISWRSAYRKLAGLMMSLRTGFWLYDMGGGWYSPPEIASDIGESVRTMNTFALRRPSPWRPDVAVVVDEANAAVFGERADLKLPIRKELAARNCNYFAASGVPYEMYLAEDVLADPATLGRMKMVVFSLFRCFDDRRLEFVRQLRTEGKTLVFLAESGVAGCGIEATGFKTFFDRRNRSHHVVAAEGVGEDCASPLCTDYMRVHCSSKGAYSTPIGPRVAIEDADGVRVVARYSEDGAPAVAYREDGGCRCIYVAEPNGFTPALFNRFAREAGAYVPHAGTGLQVDMNGDFISVHALKSGQFDFALPFSAKVVNLKSGKEELQWDGKLHLELTAGETCWFRLDAPQKKVAGNREEGWEGRPSARRISDPGRAVVWRAPFGMGVDGFDVEKRFGAEGEVAFAADSITIDKTNDLGVIIVRPKVPYAAKGPVLLRAAVREQCVNARPLETTGAVRLYGKDERLVASPFDWHVRHWGGGGERNSCVLNTPPGVGEWKYGYDCADTNNGCRVTPAIVLSDAACKTRWSDWRIEDGAEIEREWKEISAAKRPSDRVNEMVSEETFEKIIEKDRDHVAKVAVRDGRSVLLVDGMEIPPVFYRSRDAKDIPGRPFRCVHAGRGMDAAGVRLQVLTVSRHWWPNGQYGVKEAVEDVILAMRTATNSLFVVAINLDPYDRFAEDNPSERWIGRDGMVVCGGGGACRKAVKPGEPWPKGMTPCTSYSSVLWREIAKRHIGQLVDEMKRTGLAKRIVGMHLTGFHDRQFSTSDFPDFSPAALASYRRYIGEPEAKIPDFSTADAFDSKGDAEQKKWLAFIKTEPCRVQNDIARHVKKCFGKDVVVIRWSYGPYSGKYINDYDTWEFLHSDALDILVAQQAYKHRGPAIPFANKMPFASYHRHGKLYLDEFDFRTWNVINYSEMSLMGLGCSMDVEMWRSTIRRAAGRMLVGGMGWWFYDMENGWFDHPAILSDIQDMLREIRSVPACVSNWHPSAAIVVDEKNILENVNLARRMEKGGAATGRDANEAKNDLSAHLPKFAASGVPFDIWLADDLFEDPSIANRYRVLFWTCCVRKDAKRAAFEEAFCAKDGRILFRDGLCCSTAESINRFAREAGAYVPVDRSGLQVDMNGGFLSLHCLIPGHYDFTLPFPAKVVNLKTGLPASTTEDGRILPLDMVAGETRWYSLR